MSDTEVIILAQRAREARHAMEHAKRLVFQLSKDYEDKIPLMARLDIDRELENIRDLLESIEARAKGYESGRLYAEDR
jgi:hypothetical protein